MRRNGSTVSATFARPRLDTPAGNARQALPSPKTGIADVLDFFRRGDVLMVTCIDRLVPSIGDLQDIVRTVKTRGASLKATEQPIDTSTAAGKCFLDMLGPPALRGRSRGRGRPCSLPSSAYPLSRDRR
jgi:hypothetical protein